MNELKPCPFCGEERNLCKGKDGEFVFIYCGNCYARSPSNCVYTMDAGNVVHQIEVNDLKTAIYFWNQRA
jgi:ribosomal protein S26